jgi:hypothetical protein
MFAFAVACGDGDAMACRRAGVVELVDAPDSKAIQKPLKTTKTLQIHRFSAIFFAR